MEAIRTWEILAQAKPLCSAPDWPNGTSNDPNTLRLITFFSQLNFFQFRLFVGMDERESSRRSRRIQGGTKTGSWGRAQVKTDLNPGLVRVHQSSLTQTLDPFEPLHLCHAETPVRTTCNETAKHPK